MIVNIINNDFFLSIFFLTIRFYLIAYFYIVIIIIIIWHRYFVSLSLVHIINHLL